MRADTGKARRVPIRALTLDDGTWLKLGRLAARVGGAVWSRSGVVRELVAAAPEPTVCDKSSTDGLTE